MAPFNGPYWDTPALDAIKEANPSLYGSNATVFTDAPNLDFHLLPGSPAIGTGHVGVQPIYDFYGNPFLRC